MQTIIERRSEPSFTHRPNTFSQFNDMIVLTNKMNKDLSSNKETLLNKLRNKLGSKS